MHRILFIGHEASRTGAPLLLLQFLRWLKARETCRIDVLLLRGGELEAEFGAVANVRRMEAQPPRRRSRGVERWGERLGLRTSGRVAPLEERYDLVVGNTVLALPALAQFKRLGMATVAWVHELDYAVESLSGERFPELCQRVDRFLAVSEAVAQMLRRRGIRVGIDVVHGFAKPPGPIDDVAAVRKRLGISPDAFVVGGCGTIEWRKGVDLFLQIARQLVGFDDIHFLWVGGEPDGANTEFRRVRHDLDRLEIGARVTFAGPQVQADRFLSAMDVFALTSREDPFPLVCLEAARMGKPLVCFEKAGGAVEFVETDAGAIVPYGDIEAFCRTLLTYRNDRDTLRRDGEAARTKVETRFGMDHACRRIWRALDAAARRPQVSTMQRTGRDASQFRLPTNL